MSEDAESLEKKLAERRARAAELLPNYQENLARLVQELEETTVKEAVAEGDVAPDFELRRADDDEAVRLSEQLRGGPVVLSFYRGKW